MEKWEDRVWSASKSPGKFIDRATYDLSYEQYFQNTMIRKLDAENQTKDVKIQDLKQVIFDQQTELEKSKA